MSRENRKAFLNLLHEARRNATTDVERELAICEIEQFEKFHEYMKEIENKTRSIPPKECEKALAMRLFLIDIPSEATKERWAGCEWDSSIKARYLEKAKKMISLGVDLALVYKILDVVERS